MYKMTAWIFLANRWFIKDSYSLSLIIFDSLVSFITEVYSLNYSSSLFSCSMSRFLTQSSVSVGESSEPQVFLLVSPSYSTLCRKDRGFLRILFSTSVIVSSFALFLGLNGSPIFYFLITEVSRFFFVSFLR